MTPERKTKPVLTVVPGGVATGFLCIECKSERTVVKDSRTTTYGYIRRRRRCLSCAARFSTIELPTVGQVADLSDLRKALAADLKSTLTSFNRLSRVLRRSAP